MRIETIFYAPFVLSAVAVLAIFVSSRVSVRIISEIAFVAGTSFMFVVCGSYYLAGFNLIAGAAFIFITSVLSAVLYGHDRYVIKFNEQLLHALSAVVVFLSVFYLISSRMVFIRKKGELLKTIATSGLVKVIETGYMLELILLGLMLLVSVVGLTFLFSRTEEQ